jgi:diaminohydroxyphosphoribosylaminopyrimidine deaminase/5-amino-6-(5-phosphoribosylamino)uracil reductase
MMQHLAERGLTRILAEGGARLAAALLREHLADRLAIFRAPSIIGGDGLPAAEGFGLARLAELPLFQPEETVWLGTDRLETYRRVH